MNKSVLLELAELISELPNKKEVFNFLQQLLTPTEADSICKRWEIVKLLHQKIPQREIADKLHVSLCNITRGSKELQKKDNLFSKILENKGVAHV